MNKRLGRIVAVMLAVALILSAFPLYAFVFAATVKVYNNEDFINEVVNKASDPSVEVEIMADFEVNHTVESDFAGSINGNGHTITVKTGTALFNTILNGSTITNLGVIADSPILVGGEGYYGIFANAINGTVTNCFSYGTVKGNASGTEDCHVGGFCGSVMEYASISNSFSCVSMDITNVEYAGGFAGIIRTNTDHSDVEDEKKSTGSVNSCYSAGYINDYTDIPSAAGARRYVAGFANVEEGIWNLQTNPIINTYTSCQIVKLSNDAKPSGVDGLYDNQLSLILENSSNEGLSTRELMSTNALSNEFLITSAQYPSLKTFYNSIWSNEVKDIVSLSVTAAAFSDVGTSTRYEFDGMEARADYLTLDTYIDRTNYKSTKWSIDSMDCKIYDAVPLTSYNTYDANLSAGTSSDLVRSRYVFSDDENAVLTATLNGYTRKWHLTVSSDNPFYNQTANGTKDSVFVIDTKAELDYVRHYTLYGSAYYSLNADINLSKFDPIEHFQGVFQGNNKTLHNITLADDRNSNIGLFADTLSGSQIQDLVLVNVQANSQKNIFAGTLIGVADTTTVSNVIVKGSTNIVKTSGTAGGIIGKASNCTLEKMLISCETDAPTAGGLVGLLVGGKLSESGSTGLVGGIASTLGGLVGTTAKGTANAEISYSYSTATVLSNTSGAVAGGLVGKLTGGTLTYSYSGSLAAVKGASGFAQAQPLCGSGTAGTDCSYDGQFYQNDSTVVSVSDSKWTQTNNHYPQISYFTDKDISKDLSSVSTTLFIYQHYWEDSKSDDATTGFIPSRFNKPTVADVFCSESDVKKIYPVKTETRDGFGFEPASGTTFAAVKTNDTADVGVRYAAVIRNDLIPVVFNVTGHNDTPVFVSIAYANSKSNLENKTQLKETQLQVLEGKAIYDIPKGSFIRVCVWTQNECKLQEIKLGNLTLTDPDNDGYYISTSPYSERINVNITLYNSTTWGVQRDTV